MVTGHYSLAELSEAFADVGSRLTAARSGAEVLNLLSNLAVERVPGAEYAGITSGRRRDKLATVAATAELVHRVDSIQYELGTGPCVDAAVDNTSFNAPDLRHDSRWPEFGRRAVELTGIVSMLSIRLYIESDRELIAGLNMYASSPAAFGEDSETVGLLLATHGALAVAGAMSREKAENLMTALQSSREIGIAMGVLMAQNKVTREQAFDLLRIVSQHTHRKIADLATEVADTGVLPEVPMSRALHRPPVD